MGIDLKVIGKTLERLGIRLERKAKEVKKIEAKARKAPGKKSKKKKRK